MMMLENHCGERSQPAAGHATKLRKQHARQGHAH